MTSSQQEILLDEQEQQITIDSDNKTDSWAQRTFKPMEKGSQRGATFLAIMTAFGTGVFTLHHIFEFCGIIWGTLLEICVALAFMYYGFVMIQTSKKFPQQNSFAQLMQKSLGDFGKKFYNFITVVYLFTVAIGGLLAFSKLVYVNFSNQIWKIFNFVQEENRNINFFCKRSVWIFGLFLFVIVLQRDLSSLQHISLFSLSIYVLVIILMCCQLPYYIEQQKQNGNYEQNWYNTNYELFLTGFGLLLTSYNFNTQYYGIKNTLDKPKVYRQQKVIFRGYLVLFLFYYFIGGLAYWSLGQNANLDIFIMRKPLNNSKDILMIVLRTLLLIGVILCAALNVFPIKLIIDEQFKNWSFGKNFLISLLLTFIPVLGASLFDNVTQYLTIAGTLGGTIISFTFPGIVAIKENVYKGFFQWFLILMTILITVGGLLGTIVSIKNFR